MNEPTDQPTPRPGTSMPRSPENDSGGVVDALHGTGRTTKMVTDAVRYALVNPGKRVLLVFGTREQAKKACRLGAELARAGLKGQALQHLDFSNTSRAEFKGMDENHAGARTLIEDHAARRILDDQVDLC